MLTRIAGSVNPQTCNLLEVCWGNSIKERMKKKTVRSGAAPRKPKKERKHGPEKEKVQITVRIDKDLMDQMYAVMKSSNTRLTDLLERGAILAMREEDQDLPTLTTQVRFLVANTTKTEQEILRNVLTFLRADEIEEPTDRDRLARTYFLEYLKTFLHLRKEAMDLYSRYGRTEAEIEKLTG